MTVSVLPDTSTVATEVLLDFADTVCVSFASGSVTVTGTDTDPPRCAVWAGIELTFGGLFVVCSVTVTENDRVAVAPHSSVAVTVIVALPAATAVTVSVFPDTDTVATEVLFDVAVQVGLSAASASPTVTVRVPVEPDDSDMSEIADTVGWLFETVTPNCTAFDFALVAPLLSVAVTVIVALPAAAGVIVNVLPDTATVATEALFDVADTVCVSLVSASVTVAVRVPEEPHDSFTSEIADTTGWLFGL